MPEPIQLTEAERVEYEQRAAPTPINPVKDFSAQELADLSANDTSFDLVNAFRQQKDLWADAATVQKVADAHNLVRQRGFQLGDVEAIKAAKQGDVVGTVAGVVKPVAHVGKGFLKQAYNFASAATMPFLDIIGDPLGNNPEFHKELEQMGQRQFAENLAGTEQAVTGLSQLPGKALGKLGRAAGITKPLEQFSPEEKASDLWDAVGKGETAEDIARGHGGLLGAERVGKHVIAELEQAGKPIRPEETAITAAGDPVSWWAFGRGFGAAGKLVPAPVAKVIAKGEQAAGQYAATAAGKLVQASGVAAEKVAPAAIVTGKVVKAAGPVIAAGKALLTGDIAGVFGHGAEGYFTGKALEKLGEGAKVIGPKIADFGKQVAGEVPVTSNLAQLSKDVLQTAPAAAMDVAKGAAFDLGLGLATSESPAESEGALGIGTAFGALGAAKRVGGRVLSGQLIAPREYGIKQPVASSGQFPGLETMHRAAFSSAEPAQQARLNAIREFTKGAAPGTDVFLGDSVGIETALREAGVSESQAKQFSQHEGFFTADLAGKDGKPRRVVIVKDVAAAPHEAFHAIQDVIGEPGNRQIDAAIREAYSDRWDAEGTDYAQRLAGPLGESSWQEAILDRSGWGMNEAKEKLFRDAENSLQTATEAPNPEKVREVAQQELGRRMDEVLARNLNFTPEQAQASVWRDILTPEEAAAVADRYIARELAAENFDVLFKHTGGNPKTQPGILSYLSSKVREVTTALSGALNGGNPLAGRVSEIGQIQPRTGAIEAVRAAVPEVAPRSAAPEKAAVKLPAGSPEARASDAAQARQLAAEAPDAPAAKGGRSQRELLGQMAEAISTKSGVKINYLSAPGEPAAATTSNRDVRRAIIEAFRTMPPEARSLWEKSFFPDRVIKTKGGGYQVQGWAPEVFAANAHKLAATLAKLDPAISPYEIDVTTGSFTPDAWQKLYADAQAFITNQQAGRTGAGEPLVVPKEMTERGFFAPQVTPGVEAPIPQRNADFINMLFGFKLPETPRVQKGKTPLNIAGVEVSAATKPGRVSVPVRPRGEFTGAEAERQGIAGREVAEVNPVRAEIERAAGTEMPSFIEAIQKLNLENIKEVEGAPELPEFRGNTLTLTAGFQPRQWKVSGQKGGLKKEVEVTAEDIAGARRQAEAQGMRVSNVTPVQPTALLGQFQPRSAKEIELMTPEEFRGWASKIPQGFTGAAHDMGRNISSLEEARDLRAAYDRLTTRSPKAMQEARALMQSGNQEGAIAKMDEAAALASQAQFFREAAEAAEGSGSAATLLKRDPNYTAPFPIEGQAQPRKFSEEELQKIRSGESFGQTFNRDGTAWTPPKDTPTDVVTLASVNVPAKELTSAKMTEALGPYSELLDKPGVVAGVFRFEREGEPMVSIDVNATVPQEFRDNSMAFAKANDQVSIWDATKGQEVPTGGSGNTKLKSPEQISTALDNLVQGQPVDVSTISGQAQPRKAKDEFKFQSGGPGGFSKAWILPNGKVEQLGGMWHHHWLAEDPVGMAEAKRLKLKVPPFEGTDAEGVRESALQKGFARVNYDVNTGTLTVEARAKDWAKQKAAVEQIVQRNLDDIDNLRVSLLDDSAAGTVDNKTAKLFQLDTDAQKLAAIPFLNEAPRAARATRTDNPAFTAPGEEAPALRPDVSSSLAFQVYDASGKYIGKYLKIEEARVAAGEGGNIKVLTGQAQPQAQPKKFELGAEPEPAKKGLTRDEVATMSVAQLAKHYPESVIPKSTDAPIGSDIVGSPLYKKAKTEEAAVQAFADGIVEFAEQWKDNPQFVAGSKWYSEFTPMLKAEFGEDTPIMAELLAATSPRLTPDINYAMAVDALEGFKSNRFAGMKEKYEEGLKKIADSSWKEWYTARLEAGKVVDPPAKATPATFLAEWITEHDLIPKQSNGKKFGMHSIPVLQVLARQWLGKAGLKTQNFVKNLVGEAHEATIDLWADRTMRRIGYASKKRWRILPKNTQGVADKDFLFAQKAFRRAAEMLDMQPDDLQGALWFAEKQYWADRGWSPLNLGDYRAEVPKTAALRERAASRSQQGELGISVEPRKLQ